MDDWREMGACFRSADPRFFGVRGRASRGYTEVIEEYCGSCPVEDRCLLEGLMLVELAPELAVNGVWGGLAPARVVVAYRLLGIDPTLTLPDLRELTREISNPTHVARSSSALKTLVG